MIVRAYVEANATDTEIFDPIDLPWHNRPVVDVSSLGPWASVQGAYFDANDLLPCTMSGYVSKPSEEGVEEIVFRRVAP